MHSPETGIIDSHRYMLALRRRSRRSRRRGGVQHADRAPRAGAGRLGGCISAAPIRNRSRSTRSSTAPGSARSGLRRATEGYPPERVPRLVLAKGNYFGFAGRPAFSRLIYPVPIPGGLGVHVTLDLAGRMRFGPDVEWIEQENYDVDPDPRDGVLPAHPRLLARPAGRLAGAGLCRDQAEADGTGRGGGGFHDRRAARSTGSARLVHLFGIESPGLTCCAFDRRGGRRTICRPEPACSCRLRGLAGASRLPGVAGGGGDGAPASPARSWFRSACAAAPPTGPNRMRSA